VLHKQQEPAALRAQQNSLRFSMMKALHRSLKIAKAHKYNRSSVLKNAALF
jgi:hypothetical protein